jgi:uncharacterized membrane protein YdbT with pleckstrin-like domain
MLRRYNISIVNWKQKIIYAIIAILVGFMVVWFAGLPEIGLLIVFIVLGIVVASKGNKTVDWEIDDKAVHFRSIGQADNGGNGTMIMWQDITHLKYRDGYSSRRNGLASIRITTTDQRTLEFGFYETSADGAAFVEDFFSTINKQNNFFLTE